MADPLDQYDYVMVSDNASGRDPRPVAFQTATAAIAGDANMTSQYSPLTAWKHPDTRAFLRSLSFGSRATSLAVLGDSTGNDTVEWVYLVSQYLATQYPALTVHYRLFDDTAQGWSLPTVLQTGTAGEAYFTGNGSEARAYQANDSTQLDVTGDLSLRVKFQPAASWASGSSQCLVSKFGSAGQRSWRFEVTAAGNLYMEISNDGTANLGKTSTVIVPFGSAVAGWVRADVDVNNGASGWDVLFYTSTDGTNWTQLGTTVTTATATSIFDSTAQVQIGHRNGSVPVNGNMYAFDMYNGIVAASPLVASWRAGEMYLAYASIATGIDCCGNTWTATATAAAVGLSGAPVLTMLNASVSGQDLSYFTNATRFAKVFAGRIKLAFVNLGHNHAGLYYDGDGYFAAMNSFVTQMRAVQADCGVVFVAQNPELSPQTAEQIRAHKDRARELASVAAIGGHGFVDVFTAFTSAGAATYTNADGIHPNTAGSALWSTTVQAFLAAC